MRKETSKKVINGIQMICFSIIKENETQNTYIEEAYVCPERLTLEKFGSISEQIQEISNRLIMEHCSVDGSKTDTDEISNMLDEMPIFVFEVVLKNRLLKVSYDGNGKFNVENNQFN